MTVTTKNSITTTRDITIKTGIFQGDCPSGLNFVIALLPLSWLLKRSGIGYNIGPKTTPKKISHLLFMDDLKCYANTENQMKSMLKIVQQFSNDIKMKFGLEKCNLMKIEKGKITKTNDITLENEECIKALELEKCYKYLGMHESNEIKTKRMRTKLKNEYFERIKLILKTKLNSRNTIEAINTFAAPSITYGFNVLDWSTTELDAIDRETRNILKQYHLLHENSDVDRLYLPRREGGRGLSNICSLYKSQIIQTSRYLATTNEELLTFVSTWQTKRGQKSIHKKAEVFTNELDLDLNAIYDLSKLQAKETIRKKRITVNREKLSEKRMHGQYARLLNQPHVNKEESTAFLRNSQLKRSTESAICAIQEQSVTTKYIKKMIHKTTNDDRCRACGQHAETIHHVISGCPVYSTTKYLQRHDNICKYVHMLLLDKYDIPYNAVAWWKYDPDPLVENDEVKILWNFPVQTDQRVQHNKPDIMIIEKRSRKAHIIDVAVPNDNNIARKHETKIRDYTDLSIEIKRLWDLENVTITPIIVGATGVIHERFKIANENLGININISEVQKIAILGTVNITRAFFSLRE